MFSQLDCQNTYKYLVNSVRIYLLPFKDNLHDKMKTRRTNIEEPIFIKVIKYRVMYVNTLANKNNKRSRTPLDKIKPKLWTR